MKEKKVLILGLISTLIISFSAKYLQELLNQFPSGHFVHSLYYSALALVFFVIVSIGFKLLGRSILYAWFNLLLHYPLLAIIRLLQLYRPIYKKMLQNNTSRKIFYKSFALTCGVKNSQIDKVYEWEYSAIYQSNKRGIDINPARTLIYKIYNKYAPKITAPKIVVTKGDVLSGTKKRIRLKKRNNSLDGVLHETSHALLQTYINDRTYDPHGIEFTSIFIKLLAEHGFGDIDTLVQSAHEYVVKTLPAENIKKWSVKEIAQEGENNV